MAYRPLLKLPGFVAVLAITAAGTACVSTPESGVGSLAATDRGEVRRIEDLVLVDCLLPGQIRQLGTQMTYLAPRRRAKTTKSDCGIRGGEFVVFDRSDYRTALQTLLPQARAGDAVAQTYVGEIYERGLGLAAPDHATAAVWYRKAADQGHSPAQTSLGSLYERGLGVPRQKSTALNLYRQAVGLTGDKVVFESRLKAERARFQREIALRNSIAASLEKELRVAKSRRPEPRVVDIQAPAPSGPSKGIVSPSDKVAAIDGGQSDRAASDPDAPVREPPPASTHLQVRDLLRAADSLSLGTESAARQAEKEAHALKEVAKAEAAAKNQARVGKMKLSLRQKEQEVQALQASVIEQRRLLAVDQPL